MKARQIIINAESLVDRSSANEMNNSHAIKVMNPHTTKL
jgi:hypothetical protein